MFARRVFTNGKWSVVVTKTRSPLSPIVETIGCGSKGDAWTNLQRIKTELEAMPKTNVFIEAEIIKETEKAFLLEADGVQAWVPKSAVTDHDNGFFSMTEDLAAEKGFA